MKRSEINSVIKKMENLLAEHKFYLPEFCNWTPEEWQDKNDAYDEIRDTMLGWDVTDYGMGDYSKMGLTLITLRNGNINNDKYPKPYSEKIIMIEEGQVSPMHFHWNKMEDIINRGGGNIIFTLYNTYDSGELLDTDVEITQDGHKYFVKAGEDVLLKPGESMTLHPYSYHGFIIEPGTGTGLIGEVSMLNNDATDNRFLEPIGRFPEIEEDEPAYRLLCTEYPRLIKIIL